ncbi:hypothetical protein DFJ58DRAFT_685886 [Suillus subalutaceus]|uniref:uncharacterized protein n=1 Tax=Suillus subalutaceus TaxID=48586 RepID=UPI001B85C858|nr:uncharacterized protein DFJ58DRAFT_685886 [Suillus subalutaceus]KAG1848065.1 hypothetical protein DFJ58DRAFT_685886 [Suillus subalutaceus]
MPLLVLFCIFFYLVGVIQAAPTINTTLTSTTTTDSFEAPSFTTRTIWSIISSSVLTLFACIYSAIHPNIPSPKDSPNGIVRRRVGIMIMALITPELIVTWAMRQWFSARQVTRQIEESGYPSVEKQSVEAPKQRENCSLRLLAVLTEGVSSVLVFLRHFPGALTRWVKSSIKAYFSEQSEDYTWTQTHSFFVLMGGFMLYVDGKPYHTLQPDEVLKLIRDQCIDAPTLTANQIHDRSKGNAISKGLIMLQVAWFVMQLITRAIYHLETTQLEAGTLAFAVLNFLTYAVWWNKPLNVQCPHPVYWKSTESRPENHINVNEPNSQGAVWAILGPVFVSITDLIGLPFMPISRKLRVPTFDGSITLEGSDKRVLLLSGLLMATIFGGIHCMAWFFAFPTYQERVLWRMSAIAITFTPWVCFLVGVIHGLIPRVVQIVCILTTGVSVILYITARAVLLVLMFTTLRNLPPDAYKAVSWTSLVPHL